MRHPASILAAGALFLGALSAHAQQQERGFKERVLGEPDRTLEFHGWKNGFNSGKSSFNASTARVQKFQFKQKVRPKDYVTRNFLGTRGAWEGEFLYRTDAASTEGRYIIPKKDSEYVTEQVDTEIPVEAEKKARSREYATRGSTVRGSAQGSLDEQYNKNKEAMSIDDVRELLNKSE